MFCINKNRDVVGYFDLFDSAIIVGVAEDMHACQSCFAWKHDGAMSVIVQVTSKPLHSLECWTAWYRGILLQSLLDSGKCVSCVQRS